MQKFASHSLYRKLNLLSAYFAELRGLLTAPGRICVGAVSCAVALASLGVGAHAEGIESLSIMPDLDVRGQGWAQVANLYEMLDYGLGVIEIILLTLMISFHPVNRNDRRSLADFERPRMFFLYMVIGMTVGFLVLHHGYIIGFVIFGMGGLLRLRGEATSTQDTTRLIIATLLGLAVGLDLPVIAFIAAGTGWIALYLFSLHMKLSLEVKFSEKKSMQQSTERLTQVLQERGFKTLGHTKAKFKPVVEFVLEGERGNARAALIREMTDISANKLAPVEDWHVG